MTSSPSSAISLALSLLLSTPLWTGCAHSSPPTPKPETKVVTSIQVVEKPVPCMTMPHIRLPDDTRWAFDRGPDGQVTGTGAHLPITEIMAIHALIDYLSQQIAKCYAFTPVQ